MDPMNNQIPTPNAASAPMPGGATPPVMPVNTPAMPVSPAPTPVASPAPAQSPVINPAVQASPFVNEPTPITINPGQPSAGFGAPATPVFNPTNGGLVGATDPITMPTPPKAPDPVEEELKAPFKAAGPVPGSIGSAISVPADVVPAPDSGRAPNNVSFTDPAMTNTQMPTASMGSGKKKISKSTLIVLAVVAGLIVVVLAAYLIMTLMQGN